MNVQVRGYAGRVEPDRGRAEPPSGGGPWLSARQQQDWRSLVTVLTCLPAALDAQLKRDAGINSFEFHVLAHLAEAPGGTLVLSELAAVSQGSLSRLSHALTRLERAGWVERRACPLPGRRVEARLTRSGRAKLADTAPGHVREARRLVVDVLTPEQLSALGEVTRAITAATLARHGPPTGAPDEPGP
jgi:DNA-binding MarR family transcriptional regulator